MQHATCHQTNLIFPVLLPTNLLEANSALRSARCQCCQIAKDVRALCKTWDKEHPATFKLANIT
jgi:hypothetical protein